VDQAEALFDLFGESFDIGARKMHGSRRMFHGNENRFGYTRCYPYVMYVKWKLISVRLEIKLISVQDRCTVCAKMYHLHGKHFGHNRWYS
jgi:hypothetical protein